MLRVLRDSIILMGVLILLVSCAGVSNSELTRAKAISISKEQFAANPFGVELTIKAFDKRYKKILKQQRYTLRSPINDNYTDTIVRFYKGKTEVIFYKPMKLDAKLMGGNIYKPDVKLRNGISVGMSRKEFFWQFSDWVYDSSESLVLESVPTGCTFTFIFSKDKLKTIKISNRTYKR